MALARVWRRGVLWRGMREDVDVAAPEPPAALPAERSIRAKRRGGGKPRMQQERAALDRARMRHTGRAACVWLALAARASCGHPSLQHGVEGEAARVAEGGAGLAMLAPEGEREEAQGEEVEAREEDRLVQILRGRGY